MGNVYFIKGKDSGNIKIGYSQDVNKRLKQLQTGCSETLEIIYIIENSNPEYEKMLHKYFRHVRIRNNGEWFQDTNNVVSNFIRRNKLEKKYRKEGCYN